MRAGLMGCASLFWEIGLVAKVIWKSNRTNYFLYKAISKYITFRRNNQYLITVSE